MSDGAPLLQLDGVTKSFDGAPVLHGVDLVLRRGETVALLGENGAGKSTLLNIISGALAPNSGRVVLQGAERRWSGPKEAIDAGVAFVHQELSAVPSLTVAENIFLGDYCSRGGLIDRRAMRRRSAELLAEVGASHIDPGRRLGDYRLADQQAVEIAKALRLDLKLLLLDEPTSSLTAHEAEALFSLVRRLAARGITTVFIGHRIEEALALCGRIVVLRDGRIVSDLSRSETDRERIIAEMSGRAFEGLGRAAGSVRDEVVLSVEHLADGGTVEDVSFDLRRGEVLGLFGLVGAGRTETLEMIFGARRPVSGRVMLGGAPYAPRSPRDAIARGFALLPEGRKSNGILPNRPVAENIAAMAVAAPGAPGWIDAGGQRRMVEEAVQRLGIVLRTPSQPIRTLSGGNQQKAILARCLAMSPEVLLLDEPTHGVDVRTKAQIYDLIRQAASRGASLVVSSSEMLELMAIADRIVVLSAGHSVAVHPGSGADQVAIMRDAFSRVAADQGRAAVLP